MWISKNNINLKFAMSLCTIESGVAPSKNEAAECCILALDDGAHVTETVETQLVRKLSNKSRFP